MSQHCRLIQSAVMRTHATHSLPIKGQPPLHIEEPIAAAFSSFQHELQLLPPSAMGVVSSASEQVRPEGQMAIAPSPPSATPLLPPTPTTTPAAVDRACAYHRTASNTANEHHEYASTSMLNAKRD